MQNPRLTANIEEITTYTARYPELQEAHHFIYDLRRPSSDKPMFVVMGINPGESNSDWELVCERREETSRHDFHAKGGPSRSARRWASDAQYYLDNAPYVLAEVFLWSSKGMAQFGERFGSLKKSPHLPICTKMNKEIIEVYKPKAVVLPGIGMTDICASLYELEQVNSVNNSRGRVIEHYTDGTRPWIFTKHWTGARGFTVADRITIKDYIGRYS
jgi:hypothetical protein